MPRPGSGLRGVLLFGLLDDLLRSSLLVLLDGLLGDFLHRLGGAVCRNGRGGCGRSSRGGGRRGGGVAESRHREGESNTEAEGGEDGLIHGFISFFLQVWMSVTERD